jgi:hypothetical protein
MRCSLIDDRKWKMIIPNRDSESCLRSRLRRLTVAPPRDLVQSCPLLDNNKAEGLRVLYSVSTGTVVSCM